MNSLLFDIGANRGLYTDANRSKYQRSLLVEANPSLCTFLEEKYHGTPSIEIVNTIVSNKASETFYISNADTISTVDKEWIHNSRFAGTYQWQPVENIPTCSIDGLVGRYGLPSFIKIDVEGYEYNVLLSMTKAYSPLCFEWAEEKKDELLLSVKYLDTLGYTKFAVQQEDSYDYTIRDDEWMSYEDTSVMLSSLCDATRKKYWGMLWAS